MALLSAKQQEVLDEMAAAKDVVDNLKADALAAYQEQCWEIEGQLRELVREAREIGVPYRQIGMRLGTSDHVTIKNMEQEKRRSAR